MHSTDSNIWIKNFESCESPDMKTLKCHKENGKNKAWHNIERLEKSMMD